MCMRWLSAAVLLTGILGADFAAAEHARSPRTVKTTSVTRNMYGQVVRIRRTTTTRRRPSTPYYPSQYTNSFNNGGSYSGYLNYYQNYYNTVYGGMPFRYRSPYGNAHSFGSSYSLGSYGYGGMGRPYDRWGTSSYRNRLPLAYQYPSYTWGSGWQYQPNAYPSISLTPTRPYGTTSGGWYY